MIVWKGRESRRVETVGIGGRRICDVAFSEMEGKRLVVCSKTCNMDKEESKSQGNESIRS